MSCNVEVRYSWNVDPERRQNFIPRDTIAVPVEFQLREKF